jgi:hypothetical protein
MSETLQYNDDEMVDFLQTLDEADVEVDNWEAGFIASNLDAIHFSDGQRKKIMEMIEKYGKRIGWL